MNVGTKIMYFDHCVNYVKFLFEGNYNFVNFIRTLQYKLFVFLSEERSHTCMKKKTIKQTNKTITITKNFNKTKEGLYFWVNA